MYVMKLCCIERNYYVPTRGECHLVHGKALDAISHHLERKEEWGKIEISDDAVTSTNDCEVLQQLTSMPRESEALSSKTPSL